MPSEIFYFIVSLILLFTIWWLANNATLTTACPKCKSDANVKRIKRSGFTKYIMFFLFAKKLRCDKCWKVFYQLFASGKPDPNLPV